MQLDLGDTRIDAHPDDDLLTALIRAGRMPAGALCMAGDCPNCLAVVDGVAYVRMCLTRPRDGMSVIPFPVERMPDLPTTSSSPRQVSHRSLHVDVVVIGGGESGRAAADAAAGGSVVVLDERRGDGEALAVYPGPEVVARVDGEVLRLHASRVVIATGAADILPVVPGSRLRGILSPTAARRLDVAGIDLGDIVAIGEPPDGLPCRGVDGELVRFEGADRIEAVVTRTAQGDEVRHPCQTAVVNLGTYPRDALARMGADIPVEVTGAAASDAPPPPCPVDGVVCPCSGVESADLRSVWERGFRELELVKRATLAGTGTCQGGICGPYLRSFVEERTGTSTPSFTSRPLARQMTLGEAAAAHHFPAVHRTALDATHRALGARMDRMGGWWRPWTYGDLGAEYSAVRGAVSLGDVGTLGKVLVAGPDAAELLERVYPCHLRDLSPGRSRYALVLAESGGVLDDGLVARIDQTRFWLTFTSGGAGAAEAWLRDWAGTWDADVRIMDVTHSFGAINVTGPATHRLLERAGLEEPLRFMSHRRMEIAGVDCRLFRLSFTGEISYELHHSPAESERLWQSLTEMGTDLGLRPHGLEALQALRLEKGHVIIGMDTEPDSSPRRLGMEWAVAMDKPDFIGRAALLRTGRLPLDRRLVGLRMDGKAPVDGTPIFLPDGTMTGYVTSAFRSPTLGQSVMLAWVELAGGEPPAELVVDGRPARLASLPFYDPEGTRARA